jgi:N-acetylglucosaminyldiphosphoundecaprenol N-acetyl-beta-D-mannosaminyltransferase
MPELVEVLDYAIVNRIPVHVWGISIPMLSLVRRFPEIVDFSQQFDIVVPDGAGVHVFGRFFGQSIRAHVGLPYVAQKMIKLAASKGYRLLILGATPEVNAEAGRRLLGQYPSLQLCPGIDGYYPPESEAEVALRIRNMKPDILLVGMSLPKKELFLLRWKDFMQVPVGVACGGYLDVLAGKTSLAPKIMERLALSWLWRFIQEPKRLFSNILVSQLLFLFYVLPVGVISQALAHDRPIHIYDLFHVRRDK